MNANSNSEHIPNPPQKTTSPSQVKPTPPVDPKAVSRDAVKTVGDKKYGWQQPAQPIGMKSDLCAHIGLVHARLTIDMHEVGDEWVCQCGQVFVVSIGEGGNKIFTKKSEES